MLAYYNNRVNLFSQSEKDIAINKMRRHDNKDDLVYHLMNLRYLY